MTFPRRITSASLAKWINWSPARLTRALRTLGIARKDPGLRTRVYIYPEELAASWPELYEVILEHLDEIPEVKDRRGCPKGQGKARYAQIMANKQGVAKLTRVKTDPSPVYDYDAHPCSYELGGGWSCAPECDNPNHK